LHSHPCQAGTTQTRKEPVASRRTSRGETKDLEDCSSLIEVVTTGGNGPQPHRLRAPWRGEDLLRGNPWSVSGTGERHRAPGSFGRVSPPPRIPPLPPAERDERAAELLAPLTNEGRVLNIFATLVRHPRLFNRWSPFGGTLLYRGELSARHRELLILRTAWHCRAQYEWGQHVRIAKAAGLTDDEISRVPLGGDAAGWDGLDAALLRAADELHRDASINDDTWSALAAELDERQLIEVCMVVGQYHLVAFTLNSLGVEPEADAAPFPQ
jgi:4-carboxymuconolactone decarboxylase